MLPNPDANATSAAGSEVAVSTRQGEWTGAELGGQHAGEVPRRVAEPCSEPGHALALDDAVGDEPHRAGGEVVAEIPFGRAGHGIGEAPLAGAEARLVRGSGSEVEAHVRRLRR